eukprot:g53881.t1
MQASLVFSYLLSLRPSSEAQKLGAAAVAVRPPPSWRHLYGPPPSPALLPQPRVSLSLAIILMPGGGAGLTRDCQKFRVPAKNLKYKLNIKYYRDNTGLNLTRMTSDSEPELQVL